MSGGAYRKRFLRSVGALRGRDLFIEHVRAAYRTLCFVVKREQNKAIFVSTTSVRSIAQRVWDLTTSGVEMLLGLRVLGFWPPVVSIQIEHSNLFDLVRFDRFAVKSRIREWAHK